jgi:hypothetical protein
MTVLDQAAASHAAVALPLPLPVPDDDQLPPALARAVKGYQAVVSKHRAATAHLGGHHARAQAARSRDVEALRKASKPEEFTPHHEAAEQVDRDRTMLEITALQAEAVTAEATVRRTAVQVAEQYRRTLAERAEVQRQAVMADVDAIKDRLIELRRVESHVSWLAQASQPTGRVKALGADTSGIDEALAPITRLLAEPSERGLDHYLANLGPGDHAGAFTVTPGSVTETRQRRTDDWL